MSRPVMLPLWQVRIAVVLAIAFMVPWNICAAIGCAWRELKTELRGRMREDFAAAAEHWRTGQLPRS